MMLPAYAFSSRFAFWPILLRPAFDVSPALLGLLFGDGAHPIYVWRQRLAAKNGWICYEGLNTATVVDDLLSGGRVIERILQSG